MKTLKRIALYIAVFFLGAVIGSSGDSKTVSQPAAQKPAEVRTIEKVIERTPQEWKDLKTMDDRGFNLAAEAMSLCSQGYSAAADLDTARLSEISLELKAVNQDIDEVAAGRSAILKKLGY